MLIVFYNYIIFYILLYAQVLILNIHGELRAINFPTLITRYKFDNESNKFKFN